MRATIKLVFFALAATVLFSCKNETEEFTSEPLSDYVPLQVGKYITYRLDSTVFTNLNRNVEVHSYQEKHVVDAQFTDNMGRNSYRIIRYLRNVDGGGAWMQAAAYVITPTEKTVEVNENNLRFVKLALPIKQDFSWRGNQYLPDEPFSGMFSFNNDNRIWDWDYRFDSVNTTLNLNGTAISNVIKVVGIDESDIPDTIQINGADLQLPATAKTIYLRGSASDTFNISALPPSSPGKLSIYNRSNWAAKFENIYIPANGGKSFEYIGNKWEFGYVDGLGQRKDSNYFDLPIASRDLLVDKYAKGIGLVFQELIMWEFHPVANTSNDGTTHGFGVRRTMIDHN